MILPQGTLLDVAPCLSRTYYFCEHDCGRNGIILLFILYTFILVVSTYIFSVIVGILDVKPIQKENMDSQAFAEQCIVVSVLIGKSVTVGKLWDKSGLNLTSKVPKA